MRAKGEVVRLTAQLRAAESRVVKLENYLEMARAYDGIPNDASKARNGGSPLVAVSVEIIRERGTRQPTRLLVEELERRGHHIGGTNKVTNLSGALSRAPSLSANRIEGWGLKEWESDGPLDDAHGEVSGEDDGLGPFIPPHAPPETDEVEDDDPLPF